MQDALRRLNHPHYVACSLLCLPFPLTLAVRLNAAHNLAPSFTTGLLAAPVLLALAVAVRKPSDNIGQSLGLVSRKIANLSTPFKVAPRANRVLLRDDHVPTTPAQLVWFRLHAESARNGMARRLCLLCPLDGRVTPFLPFQDQRPILIVRDCSRILLSAATGLPRTLQVGNPLDRGAEKEKETFASKNRALTRRSGPLRRSLTRRSCSCRRRRPSDLGQMDRGRLVRSARLVRRHPKSSSWQTSRTSLLPPPLLTPCGTSTVSSFSMPTTAERAENCR